MGIFPSRVISACLGLLLLGLCPQAARLADAADVSSSFTHDAGGRLTRAAHGDGQSLTYVYDGAGNIISLTVVGNVTPSTVTIVASSGMNGMSGMGGSIQPAGSVSVNYGSNCSFAISPFPQYNVSSLRIDDVVTAPATSHVFSSVTADHSIHAEFLAKTQDIDNDGLLDNWEIQYFGQLTVTNGSGDGDADGLNDRTEYALAINPKNKDSDGDAMPDKWEVDHRLDPARADGGEDPDGDGWSNALEFRAGTDPWNVLSHPVLGGVAPLLNLLLRQ